MSILENSPELLYLCGFLVFYVVVHWAEGNSKACSGRNLFTEIFGESSCYTETSESNVSKADLFEQKKADEQTIAELRERIEVLEKIVTDSRYELEQKINRL